MGAPNVRFGQTSVLGRVRWFGLTSPLVRPNLPLDSAEPPNLTPNRILGKCYSLWLTVVVLYAYMYSHISKVQGQFCLHNCILNAISIFVNIFLHAGLALTIVNLY